MQRSDEAVRAHPRARRRELHSGGGTHSRTSRSERKRENDFIKLCNGLLTPSSGELRICGYAPGKESKALVSYLPDRPYLPNWMDVTQALDMYEDFYADFDRKRALEMLAHLGIVEKQRIRQMSKGTKEKVQLILVMSRAAALSARRAYRRR